MTPKQSSRGYSRRSLFSILPAAGAACGACTAAARCASAQTSAPPDKWSEKADLTWEQIFRFAYQKDYIPLMNGLAERIGREKFIAMIQETSDAIVRQKMGGRADPNFSLKRLSGSLKNLPPLFDRALTADIVEDSPAAIEYKVTRCLWAKSFRESKAGDLGYAIVCYPDLAVAANLSPKLKLIRTKTLMQGDDCCHFRYTMEA